MDQGSSLDKSRVRSLRPEEVLENLEDAVYDNEGTHLEVPLQNPKKIKTSNRNRVTGRNQSRNQRNAGKKTKKKTRLKSIPWVLASFIFVLLAFHLYVLYMFKWNFGIAVFCICVITAVAFPAEFQCEILYSPNPISTSQKSKASNNLSYLLKVSLISLGMSIAIPKIATFSPSRTLSDMIPRISVFNSFSEDYSYVVSLIDRKGTPVCAGALIAPNVVLSAARCSRFFLIGIKTEGDDDLLHEISDVVTHPDWIPGAQENDLVLLLLKFPLNKATIFVDDGCSSVLKEGMSFKAFDWVKKGRRLLELMVTKLIYLPNYRCKDMFISAGVSTDDVSNIVGQGVLCASKPRTLETGQLGSPLTIPYASLENTDYMEDLEGAKDVIFGLVTTLTMIDTQVQYPGVYVRVSHVRFWIQTVLREKWNILLDSRSECKLDPPPEINSSPIYFAIFIIIFYIILLL